MSTINIADEEQKKFEDVIRDYNRLKNLQNREEDKVKDIISMRSPTGGVDYPYISDDEIKYAESRGIKCHMVRESRDNPRKVSFDPSIP